VARLQAPESEKLEIDLLLEGVFRCYGFDFRNYAPASLKRRIWQAIREENLTTIAAFHEKILRDQACMERFAFTLAINVTSMFRDPSFYRVFRERVVPRLRTYPFVRIWLAGCSSGEEVYSMAILLDEEGIYERCRIYATDMSQEVISRARTGIYALARMKEYTINYQQAGGSCSFSDYYTARYEKAVFRQGLKKNVVFAVHNLVTDASFNEFNVIFCRNVMIYFNRTLQEHVYGLFHESLSTFGYLGLGSKESLVFDPWASCYEAVDDREQLYRRVR